MFSKKLKIKALEAARLLRKKETPAEKYLWNLIKNKQINGLKFYRQRPVFIEYLGRSTFYIADFYCAKLNLILELDGKIHDFQKDRDQLRTEMIARKDIKVIRFSNETVFHNSIEIIEEIKKLSTSP